MGATVTAESKSKKGKSDLSSETTTDPESTLQLEAVYGATAGMPLFLDVGLQRKLAVGSVDDPLEREADRVSDAVMSSGNVATRSVARSVGSGAYPRNELAFGSAGIQRKCACGRSLAGECEECQKNEEGLSATPKIQRRTATGGKNATTGGKEPGVAPPIVHEVLRSPGQPLDNATRDLMESSFGRDFRQARIHSDGRAAESARAVNALAYTVGSDLVFGEGTYQPGTAEGKKLLAHELTHVAQQAYGPPRLARQQKVAEYETAGVAIDRAQMETAANIGYWSEKFQDYGFDPHLDRRLSFDGEEQNAVLAATWQIKPLPNINQPVTKMITVPKRPAKGSKDVTYEITFRPAPAANQKGDVELVFVFEGAAVSPEAPSTSFTPKTTGGIPEANFPQNNPAAYWQAHGEEYRRVYSWMENTAPDKFDQLLTITVGNQSTSFLVKGTKDPSGRVTAAAITYVGSTAVARVPQDYFSHDFSDVSIEELRTTQDPIHHDKLGRINGLDPAHLEEHSAVKYVIAKYFKSDQTDPLHPKVGTRNAEVDAIVPIVNPPLSMRTRANTNRRVLYTLRFLPGTNDVEVQRIGEEGRDVSLKPEGSLAHVNGFAAHTQGATEADRVAALTAWLKTTRYKGVALPAITASTTVADVERDITTKIRAGSNDPQWFEANYGIKVLGRTAAEARLRSLGFNKTEDLRDLKDLSEFTAELPVLEVVLEKMSDAIVGLFNKVALIRQKVYFDWVPPARGVAGHFDEKKDTAGITRGGLSKPTITIFDAAFVNVDSVVPGRHRAQWQAGGGNRLGGDVRARTWSRRLLQWLPEGGVRQALRQHPPHHLVRGVESAARTVCRVLRALLLRSAVAETELAAAFRFLRRSRSERTSGDDARHGQPAEENALVAIVRN